MPIQRLDNVGIVVDDLTAVTRFFVELGMTVLIEDTVEGTWVDRVVGLDGVRTQLAILQTADGHGRLELMKFLAPGVHPGDGSAPPNTLGIRRLAFVVDNLDTEVAALHSRGIDLVGEVVRYEDAYLLCYIRGPEGIIVMLAQELS